ncbi:MAG: hypothetical protein DRJ03_01360 [Chloroflexi bacterium]|nr:MAG: hypothetical protein DRJ03_01360 [Chloroflexota bacterium]
MTDSLEDLGTIDVMTWVWNWSPVPRVEFLFSRTLRDFGSTAQEVVSETDYNPFQGQYEFLISDKETEYDFLEFFLGKRGRTQKFWCKSPHQTFTLKSNVGAGSSLLYVEDNRADYIWQGHERIWIKLANGDEITRQVSNVVRDTDLDRIELHLETLITTGFDIEDVVFFGRIYLVRCDLDKYQVSYESDKVCTVTIKVYETVREYDDI